MSRKGPVFPPATYRVTLGYDGAAFGGFARQPRQTTVEGALRAALQQAAAERPLALASGGRTDRGVHAVGQVVSFKAAHHWKEHDLADRLAAAHPRLWIEDFRRAPDWFHATFAAYHRHYVYLAPEEAAVEPPHVQRLLDGLAGRRCFSAFARDTPAGQNTQRRLQVATVQPVLHQGEPCLRFDIVADSFLRRMVRVLVATALRAAREGRPTDELARLSRRGDRSATAPPAPAERLFLKAVSYGANPR